MTVRHPLTIVTALALCLALGGCSSGSAGSGVSAAAAGSTDSATPSVAASTAGPSAPASSPASTGSASTGSASTGSTSTGSTSTVSASPGTTAVGGHCSSIDQASAEAILGFSTKPGLSSTVVGTSKMKKLDDCVYQNLASGSLGYTVAQVDAQIGTAMIVAIKARMAGAGTQVTIFETGLPNAIGFTQKLPLGVDSQITVLVGDRLISVASTRKDGDVATSRSAAVAAAQKLAASA